MCLAGQQLSSTMIIAGISKNVPNVAECVITSRLKFIQKWTRLGPCPL